MADSAFIGKVFGTGNANTRYNEVTADMLASVRRFIFGYDACIFSESEHDFDCVLSQDNTSVTITDGMFCAYGYVGQCEQTTFNILPPAVEQYHLIYAELDRSVIPNTCITKIKNNQSSPYYDTAFRQDVLSEVKTGIYQVPLWRVKITNNGISELMDIRPKVYANGEMRLPCGELNVYHADDTHKITGSLENGVTCVTQTASDNSNLVASTAHVMAAIQAELNK